MRYLLQVMHRSSSISCSTFYPPPYNRQTQQEAGLAQGREVDPGVGGIFLGHSSEWESLGCGAFNAVGCAVTAELHSWKHKSRRTTSCINTG